MGKLKIMALVALLSSWTNSTLYPIGIRSLTAYSRVNVALESRKLQMMPITTHPFILNLDFSAFDASVNTSLTNNDEWTKVGNVSNKITEVKNNLAKVQSYMKKFFTVKFQEELKFSATKCSENRYSFGPQYIRKVDYYLNIILENNPFSESPVQAIDCLVDANTGRPIVGIFLLNLGSTPDSPPATYQLFKRYLHEFFHLLGLSSYEFANFPGISQEGQYTTSTKLTTETGESLPISYFLKDDVKLAAQTYFSCSSLEGLPLDYQSNEIPIGNHFSFLQLPYSLMNPVPTIDPVIDNLTIAALRSTTWYSVNETAAEKEEWEGYDRIYSNTFDSCDSVKKVCPAVKHRCSTTEADNKQHRCSTDRRSKQICGVQPQYGNVTTHLSCAFWQNTMQYCRGPSNPHDHWDKDIEEISDTSLCFMISIGENQEQAMQPRCLNYTCTEDKNAQSVLVLTFANGLRVNCTKEQILHYTDPGNSTQKITVGCPDPLVLCSQIQNRTGIIAQCGIDCSTDGLGICMATGDCFCFFGTDNMTGRCAMNMAADSGSSSGSATNCSGLKFFSIVVKLLAILTWFGLG